MVPECSREGKEGPTSCWSASGGLGSATTPWTNRTWRVPTVLRSILTEITSARARLLPATHWISTRGRRGRQPRSTDPWSPGDRRQLKRRIGLHRAQSNQSTTAPTTDWRKHDVRIFVPSSHGDVPITATATAQWKCHCQPDDNLSWWVSGWHLRFVKAARLCICSWVPIFCDVFLIFLFFFKKKDDNFKGKEINDATQSVTNASFFFHGFITFTPVMQTNKF